MPRFMVQEIGGKIWGAYELAELINYVREGRIRLGPKPVCCVADQLRWITVSQTVCGGYFVQGLDGAFYGPYQAEYLRTLLAAGTVRTDSLASLALEWKWTDLEPLLQEAQAAPRFASAAVPPVPVDARRQAHPGRSALPTNPVLTTAAGVALANGSIRAFDAAQRGVTEWAKNHNAPEVLAAIDPDGNGTIDAAILDLNGNGISDGADQLVVGDAAGAAVDASSSLVDKIAEWLS